MFKKLSDLKESNNYPGEKVRVNTATIREFCVNCAYLHKRITRVYAKNSPSPRPSRAINAAYTAWRSLQTLKCDTH